MPEPADGPPRARENGSAPTFLVTDECRRLTRWLRLMGYDTDVRPARPLPDLYRHAYAQGRIVVTRNRRVRAGCLVRVVQLTSEALEPQLSQLMREARVRVDEARAFTRCDRCNVRLAAITKAEVADRVPPYVFQTQGRFFACPSCRRIYWAATHWQRARAVFERLRRGERDA